MDSQKEDPGVRSKIRSVLAGRQKRSGYEALLEPPNDTYTLYRHGKLVVPDELVPWIMTETHAHRSNRLELQILQSMEIYWENMTSSVSEWALKCPTCSKTRPNTSYRKPKLESLTFCSTPLEVVSVDNIHCSPFYIQVGTCNFSGYTEAVCLANEKENSICQGITMLLCRLQMPRLVRLDNHRSHHSSKFKELMERMGTATSFTTPQNSRSNGTVERRNQIFQMRLKAMSQSC